jgi:hypothetical protein
MDKELQKRLHDAGFPFDQDVNLITLIEVCGSKFLDLHRWDNKWTCNQGEEVYDFESEGKTAEEAVANLWLLNK